MSVEPTVANAKELARAYGKHGVVVFHFRADGTAGYASYGSHRANCDAMKEWAERVWSWMENGMMEPPDLTP